MIDELELRSLVVAKDLDLSFLANDYDNVHFILCINPAFGLGDYEMQQKDSENVAIKAKKSEFITIQVDFNEDKQYFQDLKQQHRNSKKILDFLRYLQTNKADSKCGYHSSSADDKGNENDFYPNCGVIWIEQNAKFSFKKVLEKVKSIIENNEDKKFQNKPTFAFLCCNETFDSTNKKMLQLAREDEGEFVKKNNVKRQPEYDNLFLFQNKDGN